MMRIGLGLALGATAAHAQTQAQLNQQAGAAFARADGALNRQWGETLAEMKRSDAAERPGGFGHAAALLASQRGWLGYRDAQCTVEGGEYAGGSMQPLVIAQCRARLTAERTAALRKLVARR